MSMFALSLLVTTTANVAAEFEVFDDGISLLQAHAELSPPRAGAAELLAADAELFMPRSPPTGLSPVALLHIPYDHIALNLTYHNLGEQILTFPERRPREFNVMLATCKTWTADAVVQFLERRPGRPWIFDWRRSAAFAIFGFIYIGLTQWFLYVTLLTWLFPDAMIFANSSMAMKMADWPGQMDMVGQVLVDNLIFECFIYFPAFYVIKSIVQGTPGHSLPTRMYIGLTKYWSNIIKDNTASCAIWVPADLFIFACPMYLRMPLEHGVSFGWTMFMSFTRGKTEAKSDDLKDKDEP